MNNKKPLDKLKEEGWKFLEHYSEGEVYKKGEEKLMFNPITKEFLYISVFDPHFGVPKPLPTKVK